MNAREYKETCKFAEVSGCLLYSNAERQILCVSSAGHELVKEWIRSGRKSGGVQRNSESSEDVVDLT
jgi:hypothetical protein